MKIRSVTVHGGDLVASHRYPDEADDAERAVYAAWVAGAIARDRYLGYVAVADQSEGREEVLAGAGVTLLDWAPHAAIRSRTGAGWATSGRTRPFAVRACPASW